MSKRWLFLKKIQSSLWFSSESTLLLSTAWLVLQSKQSKFQRILSRKANLLSFMMKTENSQNTISAKKFVKLTVCLQSSKCLPLFTPNCINFFLFFSSIFEKTSCKNNLQIINPTYPLWWISVSWPIKHTNSLLFWSKLLISWRFQARSQFLIFLETKIKVFSFIPTRISSLTKL